MPGCAAWHSACPTRRGFAFRSPHKPEQAAGARNCARPSPAGAKSTMAPRANVRWPSPVWLAPGADVPRMRFAAALLAELLAVQRSTGIPNIVAGIPLSRAAAALMRIAGPLLGKFLTLLAARDRKSGG